MSIDLTLLSYDELIMLNDQIIERLKSMDTMNALNEMAALNIGTRVSFDSSQGRQTGRVFKFNIKTVGVMTEDGRKWKVSPHLLTKLKMVTDNQVIKISGQKRKR